MYNSYTSYLSRPSLDPGAMNLLFPILTSDTEIIPIVPDSKLKFWGDPAEKHYCYIPQFPKQNGSVIHLKTQKLLAQGAS